MTKNIVNERRTGFQHKYVLDEGDIVFVDTETETHIKVFNLPNDGTGKQVFFQVKIYLDDYVSNDDANDSSSDGGEDSDSE